MKVPLRYGDGKIDVTVPDGTTVLCGSEVPAMPDPLQAVRQSLASPIGTPSLRQLVDAKLPQTVAITISDITRPVPNEVLLLSVLDVLNQAGVGDYRIVIIVATGMHRPSTPAERNLMLGAEILRRCEVIDHVAEDADSVQQVADNPPVSMNKRFLHADFKIVTGLIEPHFMAGYSGGRKGICPGLVDLETVQRFHGFEIMDSHLTENGVLEGNPCHEEALRIARIVGCDFLVNVAITQDRKPAGIYCGQLEEAHLAGCQEVGRWTSARIDEPFDLVVTNGGGYPLDATFYQTGKGMVCAAPAMHDRSTQLIVATCKEGIGSPQFERTLRRWGGDWRGFLKDIAATDRVEKDQWQVQMMTRVWRKTGTKRLCLATDGLDANTLRELGVSPVAGPGDAPARYQRFIDDYIRDHPDVRIAVIPEGPYTMLLKSE